MKSLSRREMLALLGATAAATGAFPLLSCQSKPKLPPPDEAPSILFGNSRTGLSIAAESYKHTLFGHPESVSRTDVILKTLRERQGAQLLAPLHQIQNRVATADELLRVHSADYIEKIRLATKPGALINDSRWSPYEGPFAFVAAASAAGSALALLHAIDAEQIQNGFAVTRPPGHHAARSHAAGYCIFNNIAVAVQSLLAKRQRRIAIVDFDVHHGDGIQDCFYRDPNVLYVSTHQDDWPFTGKLEMTGEGPGRGTNMNIPLPLHTGDAGLLQVYEQAVLPALERFKPEMIVVAAGFDVHWRDPQGSFELSLTGINAIVHRLNAAAVEICGGKIGYVLEGGYQLEALGHGVANTITQLNLNPTAKVTLLDPLGPSRAKLLKVDDVIHKVRKIHKL